MLSFSFLTLLLGFVVPVLSAPTVDLLIDNGYEKTGNINLREVLLSVSQRKGQPFHFGSTLNISVPHPRFTEDIFGTFFDHVVAENGCKWGEVEREPGKSNLSECFDVLDFAREHSNTFRGHNTLWHTHLPVSDRLFHLFDKQADKRAII